MTQEKTDPKQDSPSEPGKGRGKAPDAGADLPGKAKTDDAPPETAPKRPDPTRYGDWEKNGRCIDF